MGFKTKIHNLAKIQIRAWHLPDAILDEVYLHLTVVVPADIEHNLIRPQGSIHGLSAEFVRRDHDVMGRDHLFEFRVYFGDDEQTLYVAKGRYQILDD